MSATLSEIIARAHEIATGVAGDANASPLLDSTVTAQALVEQVFCHVAAEYAEDPTKQGSVQRSYALTFTDGLADLDGTILSEFLTHASFWSDDEPGVLHLSYLPFWYDFMRRKSMKTLLGYYAADVTTKQIGIILPGAEYQSGSGFSGDVTLRTIGIPAVPADPDTTFDIDERFKNDCIVALASALRGEAPWALIAKSAADSDNDGQ